MADALANGVIASAAMRLALLCLGLLLATATAGCGAPQGPHVRFAHTTVQELDAARSQGRVVWYDFEAGDDVPLVFGLVGVSEAVSEPVHWVARRPFSVVVFPDGTTMFSFDGQSLTSATLAARWSVALDADEGGARAALLVFIGERSDMPPELQR